jgi:hypothetical protein
MTRWQWTGWALAILAAIPLGVLLELSAEAR